MSEMLTGPKKIVDGLTEVFRGLTRMCEGMAEQIELLEFTSEDAEDEDKLLPPAKLSAVDTAPRVQVYVVRLEELRCRLIFSSEDRAWERYTRLREKGQQAAMPKVTSDESRKTLLKAITWKYDWIQQHKKQCFRFAEAVYARQMKDETSQSRFIEAFIQYAANLPEPNRRLLDEMYELAWYDIQLYPCSLEGKRLVKPWYDTKESGDGKSWQSP